MLHRFAHVRPTCPNRAPFCSIIPEHSLAAWGPTHELHSLSYIRLLFYRRARPALLPTDVHSYHPSVMAACHEVSPPEML